MIASMNAFSAAKNPTPAEITSMKLTYASAGTYMPDFASVSCSAGKNLATETEYLPMYLLERYEISGIRVEPHLSQRAIQADPCSSAGSH